MPTEKEPRHDIAMTFVVRSRFSHDELDVVAQRMARQLRTDFGEKNVRVSLGDPADLPEDDDAEGGEGEENVPPADDPEEQQAPSTEKPETAGPNVLG